MASGNETVVDVVDKINTHTKKFMLNACYVNRSMTLEKLEKLIRMVSAQFLFAFVCLYIFVFDVNKKAIEPLDTKCRVVTLDVCLLLLIQIKTKNNFIN